MFLTRSHGGPKLIYLSEYADAIDVNLNID
jgi:hypothetical protein